MTNYTYDMSFLNTSNTLADIVTGVNNASGGLIGIMIMTVLFVGLLASFMSKNVDFGKSIIITSFICSIMAGLLFFINLLSWWMIAIFLVTLIVGLMVEAFG